METYALATSTIGNTYWANNPGPQLNSIPTGAIFDGTCQPANMVFNVSGAVYYENQVKHYCWIDTPNALVQFNGGNPGPTLDATPVGANYDGICQGF
jgi:hypothetical protein